MYAECLKKIEKKLKKNTEKKQKEKLKIKDHMWVMGGAFNFFFISRTYIAQFT